MKASKRQKYKVELIIMDIKDYTECGIQGEINDRLTAIQNNPNNDITEIKTIATHDNLVVSITYTEA